MGKESVCQFSSYYYTIWAVKVVILIPTYNEKENITRLLKEIIARTNKLKKYSFKILIVDDNSPDGTGDLVKKFRSQHRNVYLLSHKKEGLGKAMVRGYRFTLKKLHPDVVVTNEADFGFSFSLLPKMLKKIAEGFDVVIASRHIGTGRTDGWNTNRKLNHFIANRLFARSIAGVDQVYDKNGAMRAIRVKGVLEKCKFSQFPARGFSFFFFAAF